MDRVAAKPSDRHHLSVEEFQANAHAILEQVGRVLVGQQQLIHQMLITLLAGGNALLEGVPGLGKTLLVRTLAQILDCEFRRVQFTPDLMPADIVGTMILTENEVGRRDFRFAPGPVFTNLLLADEINRATPRTQSALLEAMQEQRVTVAGQTHELHQPFFVLATQNPIEMEGTYPLPEAQLDRFLFKIDVQYPAEEELVEIARRTTGAEQVVPDQVADGARILAMQRLAREVPVAEHIFQFAARLVRLTHPDEPRAPELVRRHLRFGASPRAVQAMILGAKVMALLDNRKAVSIEDVRAVAHSALRHRLILNFEAQAAGIFSDEIVDDVLRDAKAGKW